MSVNEEDRDHNKLWKEHLAKKEIARAEIAEAILETRATQKAILAELAWIREKLTYTVTR